VERTIVIKYRWWRKDRESIDPEHMDALEERAETDIFKMIAAGFLEGLLEDNVRMHDSDPEDGIEYLGSWEIALDKYE